ncbi:cell wall-binding repeat-containing protein [Ornithinimicrobium pratense]|nr:cell wall-binding repeat-containing protein [Ornithinimicrobium pratense]
MSIHHPPLRRRVALAAAPLLVLAGLAVPASAVTAADSPESNRERAHEAGQTASPTALGTAEATPATALAVAQALAADTALVTGAAFETIPLADGQNVSAGTSTALSGFPVSGSSFGVLSTGLLENVPHPGTFASSSLGGTAVRGDTDRDVTVLRVDMDVPAGANCLSFDFKFLSEEYPNYVGSQFNDAFVAELNESTWTTESTEIVAPDNFAFDQDGEVVSINSTGLGGMTPENGEGTAFDGGAFDDDSPDLNGASTVRLAASTQVSPGTNTLYLSIFDQGDQILDSAVFLDNLRAGYTPDPGVNCTPGAVIVTHDLVLEPDTGTAPVGSTHTVTATLTESNSGDPAAGAEISFTVSGANTAAGTVSTDGTGQAEFTYTGAAPGADQITACYAHEDSPTCTATDSATFVWTQGERMVERIWGADRYGTAAAVSATWDPSVDVVYIATGGNYPDALPASARAGTDDVPVLLTRAGSLPTVTAEELERLMPQEIVVLGGDKAVNASVENALAEYVPGGADSVSRLAGKDRYGTAAAVAKTFGTDVPVVYVALGQNFPDAVTGAARAGLEDGPVLLARTDRLPSATVSALQETNPARIVVLGGEEAISDGVLTALEDYTDGTVTRLAGVDRYVTSAEVAGLYPDDTSTVFVSTGERFPDALSGGPIAVRSAAPVLLTRQDDLPGATIEQLERFTPERIVILGGTDAVSAALQVQLAAYLDDPED